MKPVIGITCGYSESANQYYTGTDYIKGVEKAGGVPVVLPVVTGKNIQQVLEVVHGILLSGGGDIDPFFFSEEPYPGTGTVDPERDLFELELTRRALECKKPVLGICRGMQVLNVACGGGVCQDIGYRFKDYLKHKQEAPRSYPSHSISINQNTLAFEIIGSDRVRVNSFHHQVISSLAPGFTVSGQAPDGVEEIIEYPDENNFVLGVQFHPENMIRHNSLFLDFFSCLIRQGEKIAAENIV